ncbi:MAG: NCS2 family permease [Candidatus Omnitrophica bacterium]|nr:NCS2 family permease [Candidatus Omnitrophota bacterium]
MSFEKIFKLKEAGTTVRTEVIAGCTTFMTMAYIIFVNPAMISQTGMDLGSAMMATCISAAVATLLMGLYANYPIALAPGMGENAFFTYTVCLTMGISWQVALGCVFLTGITFIILTITRMRQALIEAIPASIRYSIAAGIGALIAFIGLIDAGLVVSHPATLVALGKVASLPVLVSAIGLVATVVMMAKGVKGAILWGILVTTAVAIPLDIVNYSGLVSVPPSIAPTFMHMDVFGAMKMGLVTVMFIFLFMDIFDTVGTLAGVGEIGGFMKGGKFPRVGKAMLSDAVGTCVGAVCGTPTVTSYVESASGIQAGGKTGLTNVVIAALFILAIFFSPLIKMIGGGYKDASGALLHPVTAPALIIVGCMMIRPAIKIRWKDITEAIPAFLVIIMMPLTFSIASGVAIGFIAYALIKLFTGNGRKVPWLVYLLAALFIIRFIYLQAK